MAKQKEPSEKYVVIKKHTLDYKVGQVVSLTETKAKALVGKVRLQGDVVKDTASGDAIKALEKEVAELKDKMVNLNIEVVNASATPIDFTTEITDEGIVVTITDKIVKVDK